MIACEWSYLDKTAWGDGPWQTEPDKAQWPDPATGLACLAVRHPSHGNWCGYVGVPPGHPAHGKPYDDNLDNLDVHGGITFSRACAPEADPSRGICHVREPGDPEVWWLGFDCAHWHDLAPGLEALIREVVLPRPDKYLTYRDLAYVKQQCANLAHDLTVQVPF